MAKGEFGQGGVVPVKSLWQSIQSMKKSNYASETRLKSDEDGIGLNTWRCREQHVCNVADVLYGY